MSKIIIIQIIVALQIFAAGYVFKTYFEWAICSKEKLKAVGMTLLVLCFGLAIGVLFLVVMILGGLKYLIVDKLHLTFIFKYMILKRPLQFDELKFKVIKSTAEKMKPRFYQISDRIYRYCVLWAINKYKPELN